MKQFSGMHKPGLMIAGLATSSLIYLLSNQPVWSYRVPLEPSAGITQAQISTRQRYQPPSNPTSPRRAAGGGTRGGCDNAATIHLTAVAPQAHIGQTASTRPTLSWFVTDATPYPLKLQLYRYRSNQPDDDRLELIDAFDLGTSQPGWMAFTLPATLPPLVVGETYRWKIILECSPSQPSRNRIDEADLQVVPLLANLGGTDDPVQQAEQYAVAGLWYDAIAVLSQSLSSPGAATYRRELVTSLAELEAENPNDLFSRLSERLNYIADQD